VKLLVVGLALLIAAQHVFFLVLEMFLFNKPFGRKVFGTTEAFANEAAALAANQGLYNGFLAAGLLWGAWAVHMNAPHGRSLLLFFVGCVAVAGAFGGATVSSRIFMLQGLPALFTLGLLLTT